MQPLSGRPFPLGATPTSDGLNVAVSSEIAEAVEFCLFDADGAQDRVELPERTAHVWHGLLPGVGPGQRYGLRVHGPWSPRQGMRCNPAKLLIDPYATAVDGEVRWGPEVFGQEQDDPDAMSDLDSAAAMPRCVVTERSFDWEGDRRPDIPLDETVIYETHVKGFTQRHPEVPEAIRGTYAGLAHPAATGYLGELGVTAVELLPVHQFVHDDHLLARGLRNYWGYNSIGFLAPHGGYSSAGTAGGQVDDFKAMVKGLHRAGLEVILDVVYNHTAEGNHLGPTLSLRGVDNATYYVLTGGQDAPRRYYENWTGCGNSLNLDNPHAIRFVMDSLRYWAEVMHVDGFRFDLASVLGREGGRFQSAAAFFDAVSQDPTLSRVKLIAEPWDLGAYEVGNFPVDWSEWNGRFRDTARKFEKGDPGQARDLGYRITGSSDLFGDDGRSAYNTVNFVTCHDGFTLWDLVSYDRKHNEANGEENRDGTDDNSSWSSGAEGKTDDPAVLRLRRQRAKNFVCQLLFSAGTPMVLGGDEMLRTQRGNNNAYCLDDDTTWVDWRLLEENKDFFAFVKAAIGFTRRYPVFQRRTFFSNRDSNQDGRPDFRWYGLGLNDPAWGDPELRTLSYQLDGAEAENRAGSYLIFVILNADWRPRTVRIPDPGPPRRWYRAVDTSLDAGKDFLPEGQEVALVPADHYIANPRSTVVLLARP